MKPEKLKELDFKVIGGPLREIRETVINRLDRDVKPISELQVHFLVTSLALARLSKNLFRAAMSLMQDGRVAEGMDEESCLAAAPLTRSMIDGVLTLLYLLDDPRGRIEPYMRSGWAEMVFDRDRTKSEFPDSPETDDYVANLDKLIDAGRIALKVDPSEEAKLRKMKTAWPNPSKMAAEYRERTSPSGLGHLIVRLVDLFYPQTSEEVHFSFYGLIRMGSAYIREDPDERTLFLRMHISQHVYAAVAALLMLTSLLDEFFDLRIDDRIRPVWTIVAEKNPILRKLLDERFKTMPLLPMKFADLR